MRALSVSRTAGLNDRSSENGRRLQQQIGVVSETVHTTSSCCFDASALKPIIPTTRCMLPGVQPSFLYSPLIPIAPTHRRDGGDGNGRREATTGVLTGWTCDRTVPQKLITTLLIYAAALKGSNFNLSLETGGG